ncbi:unnamed protein product [Arabidopsis halleri]
MCVSIPTPKQKAHQRNSDTPLQHQEQNELIFCHCKENFQLIFIHL